MHSLDDLRAIRALESVVGDRQTQEENYRRHQDYLKSQQQGTPVAVLTYNLATRQIAVRELPRSADSEAHE
jgi:endo-alpha-1,4-polygalactosaminidase (GH114 family)